MKATSGPLERPVKIVPTKPVRTLLNTRARGERAQVVVELKVVMFARVVVFPISFIVGVITGIILCTEEGAHAES